MPAEKEPPVPSPSSGFSTTIKRIPSRSASGRQTPASDSNDNDDDRMSVSSNTNRRSNRMSDFEKECSLEQSPGSFQSDYKAADLSLVPVISDQLLREWAEGAIGFENANVGLLGKKALDLLCLKNAAEGRIDELNNRVSQLESANKKMRESNVRMQARVEQEEEYISNMLLKRIRKLKSDKESIALKYEQEEELLTNTLSKKLYQLEKQRDELVTRLNSDNSSIMDGLLQKIRKMESEMRQNQTVLDQLRREKVDMENALEQEQESLFNSLSKRVTQLEAEKRHLCSLVNGGQANGSQASAAEINSNASSASPSNSGRMSIGSLIPSSSESDANEMPGSVRSQKST